MYEATFERRWLDEARGLADDTLRLFWGDEVSGFYDTGSDHERLIVRPRNIFDNAVPCGSSVAIETLLRLEVLTGQGEYKTRALAALRPMGDLMSRHPGGFGRFLCAHDFNIGPVVEVALLGASHESLRPLAAEVFGRFIPNRVVAGAAGADPATLAGLPLLEGRAPIDGQATAFVCRNYACELPVTDPAALAKQLGGQPSFH